MHVANALNVHGDTNLFGNLTVEGDVEVRGELRISAAQAGNATISADATSVTVEFAETFSAVPVVTATLNNGFSLYQVNGVTASGFTIAIPEAAAADLTFSWTALPVIGLGEVPQATVQAAAAPVVEEPAPVEEPAEEPAPVVEEPVL